MKNENEPGVRAGIDAIEVGAGASAAGNYAIAIGQDANASRNYAIAVSAYTQAPNLTSTNISHGGECIDSESSLVIGSFNSLVQQSPRGIMIGGGFCYQSENGICYGYTGIEGARTIALGNETLALAEEAVSIGTYTMVEEGGIGSVAIGNQSFCNHESSVALGAGSTTDSAMQVAVGRRRISFLNNGTAATDAATYEQVVLTRNALDKTVDIIGRLTTKMGTLSHTKDEDLLLIQRTLNHLAHRVRTQLDDACPDEQQIDPPVRALPDLKAQLKKRMPNAENRIKKEDIALAAGPGVELGPGASTSSSASTAIGNQARAQTVWDTAIGNQAVTNSEFAIAIGQEAQALSFSTIAVGYKSVAYQHSGIVVGHRATSNSLQFNNIAAINLGHSSSAQGQATLAVGHSSRAHAAYAVALGDQATTLAANGVAIGQYAECNHENSVALGAASITSSTSQVAIGGPAIKRRLSGLSNATRTDDVITLGQLRVVQEYLKEAVHSLGHLSTTILSLSKENPDQSEDIQAAIKSLSDFIQHEFKEAQPDPILQDTLPEEMDPVADSLETVTKDSVARAGTNAVELGNGASATGNYSVAIGAGANANEMGAIAIGRSSDIAGEFSIGIGSSTRSVGRENIILGSGRCNNSNSIAIKGTALGANAITVGTTSLGSQCISIGSSAQNYTNSAGGICIGASSVTQGGQAISFGPRTQCRQVGSVSLGKEALTNATYQVSVGNVTTNQTRRISFAANGTAASDAATYRQLRTTKDALADALDILNQLVIKVGTVPGASGLEEIRSSVVSLAEQVKTAFPVESL